MSTINHVLEERPVKIGNFLVGRILPFREKRTVGPFIYIDHLGPTHLTEMENLSIGAHPHIGLSTLTYLLEGEILHRDSLGTAQLITPGSVNWMTAGSGIAHSERSPEYLSPTAKSLHGLQIWVALPKELEEMDPAFHHIDASELPQWKENKVNYKLIAGSLFGKSAGVPTYSPLYLLELQSEADAIVELQTELYGECGIYVLSGSIELENRQFHAKTFLVAAHPEVCSFELKAGTTVYIFGGEPFPEERFIYWNFVSSSKERIEQAKIDYAEKRFSPVPFEREWIPLPEIPKGFKS